MKLSAFLMLAIPLTLLSVSCSKKLTVKDDTVIQSLATASGTSITLSFTKGPAFYLPKTIFFNKLTITPQMAVWVEDTIGNHVQTLYVTKCFGKQEWLFAKSHPDSTIRTTCMPYWMNKFTKAGNALPSKNHPLPDAITAATPTGNFVINSKIPCDKGPVMLYAEFNSSFDNNEAYPEKKDMSSFNGQPSIIYGTRLSCDSTMSDTEMAIVGHGGDVGSDTTLYTDLSKLTTAKKFFSRISMQINK
jgi:hypothetical protein